MYRSAGVENMLILIGFGLNYLFYSDLPFPPNSISINKFQIGYNTSLSVNFHPNYFYLTQETLKTTYLLSMLKWKIAIFYAYWNEEEKCLCWRHGIRKKTSKQITTAD